MEARRLTLSRKEKSAEGLAVKPLAESEPRTLSPSIRRKVWVEDGWENGRIEGWGVRWEGRKEGEIWGGNSRTAKKLHWLLTRAAHSGCSLGLLTRAAHSGCSLGLLTRDAHMVCLFVYFCHTFITWSVHRRFYGFSLKTEKIVLENSDGYARFVNDEENGCRF